MHCSCKIAWFCEVIIWVDHRIWLLVDWRVHSRDSTTTNRSIGFCSKIDRHAFHELVVFLQPQGYRSDRYPCPEHCTYSTSDLIAIDPCPVHYVQYVCSSYRDEQTGCPARPMPGTARNGPRACRAVLPIPSCMADGPRTARQTDSHAKLAQKARHGQWARLARGSYMPRNREREESTRTVTYIEGRNHV